MSSIAIPQGHDRDRGPTCVILVMMRGDDLAAQSHSLPFSRVHDLLYIVRIDGGRLLCIVVDQQVGVVVGPAGYGNDPHPVRWGGAESVDLEEREEGSLLNDAVERGCEHQADAQDEKDEREPAKNIGNLGRCAK